MKKTMDTLQDYIRWRGDLSFADSPLNLVDNVILSELAYLDLSVLEEKGSVNGMTLKQCYEMIREKKKYRLLTVSGGHEDLIESFAMSPRFGSLTVNHHMQETDISKNIQFAAMHFEMPDGNTYVAFRGTDDTLVGWKEDFMMSFVTVPAQITAAAYLRKTVRMGRKYWIGGHSKGGNLAVYAASCLSALKRSRIRRIFMNDAPGFSEESADPAALEKVKPLITKIVPVYDVIGKLFPLEIEDTLIVESNKKGLMQHDMVSWLLDGTNFSAAGEYDSHSEFLSNVFNEWIRRIPHEERIAFVDALFDTLGANGARTVDEIGKFGYDKIFAALQKISPSVKDTAWCLPKTAFESLSESIAELFPGTKKDGKA